MSNNILQLIKPVNNCIALLNTVNKTNLLNISYQYLKNNNNYLLKLNVSPKENFIRKPVNLICAIDISGSMASRISDDPEIGKFSKLDLAKHSLKLIKNCLNEKDTIKFIFFDDRITVSPTFYVDITEQTKLDNYIDNIYANGSTNIKDAIREATIKDLDNGHILFLTDGQENCGKTDVDNINTNMQIHTFGFGYSSDIDTELLYKISKKTGGIFNYVPDYTMLGTSFINTLANIHGSCFNKINVSINNQNKFVISNLLYGQTKNILIPLKNTTSNLDLKIEFSNEKINEYIEIKELDTSNEIVIYKNNNNLNYDEYYYLYCVDKLLNIINNINQQSNNFKDTILQLEELYQNIDNEILNLTNFEIIEKLKLLQYDIYHPSPNNGQVTKAIENIKWYWKWGVHYLRSFTNSHSIQVCNNFKDQSLQNYSSPTFVEIRNEIEKIYNSMQIPKPSLSNSGYSGNFQSTFYNSGGPCVNGSAKVLINKNNIINEEIVENLKKGDILYNPKNGSYNEIKCILKTKIYHPIKMSYFGNLKITPYHPIFYNNKWQFPNDCSEPILTNIDYIYSFVMEDINNPNMYIEDQQIITLGHNIKDGVLNHPYFGTNKIIEDMQNQKGWNDGMILLEKFNPVYDENNLIKSIF